MIVFKAKSRALLLFNIIIILFQFEFVGSIDSGGIFSVYRFIIFPLLIFYLLMYYKSINIILSKFPIVCFSILLFFIAELFTSISYFDFNNIIAIVGQILLLLISLSFFIEFGITRSTLVSFSSWSFFHLLFLLLSYNTISVENRFEGYHWDPNYLCMYVLVAFWAKICLLNKINKGKMLLLALCCADIFMILSSLSKGGLLALVLTGSLFLFCCFRRVFYAYSLASISFLMYVIDRSRFLTWSSDMNLLDSILFRVIVAPSANDGDISSGRMEYINNYCSMVANEPEKLLLGFPQDLFMINYNNGIFPHNAFIEIGLSSGIWGFVFLLSLYYLVFDDVLIMNSKKIYLPEIFLPISCFIVFIFLTFINLKVSFLFVSLLLYLSFNLKNGSSIQNKK